MFFRIGKLLKFSKLNRKTYVLVSFFDNDAGVQACNFSKKRLQYKCFPVNFAKFLREAFFTEQLQ